MEIGTTLYHLKRKGCFFTIPYAPTLVSKIKAQTREITSICKILPIHALIFEKSQFGLYEISKPEVFKNKELYQKGSQYGFQKCESLCFI
jgi:hypothetical protein